ncbi:MAG: type 1 glutamine amidotransferase domain-containing protein [Candidatus Methanofastidiosia archaeon]
MKKGIVLLENGFQEAELLYPYYRLQEAGYEVDLVAETAGETYTGEHGYALKGERAAVVINLDDYDVVVIPGGRGPDRMRIKKPIVNLVKKAVIENKVVASICHGAQVLIEADVVRGRKATCWKSVATDLKNAGASYEDSEVVVDGNLVTSRHPGDLPAFMRETLKLLEE